MARWQDGKMVSEMARWQEGKRANEEDRISNPTVLPSDRFASYPFSLLSVLPPIRFASLPFCLLIRVMTIKKPIFFFNSLIDNVLMAIRPKSTAAPYQPIGLSSKREAFNVDIIIVDKQRKLDTARPAIKIN